MTTGHKKLTSSGIVANRPCVLNGFLIGVDGTNDPTITLYDDNDNADGNEVVPTNTYDSSLLGLNGAMFIEGVRCNRGLYCEITCSGTVEITVYYQ